MSETANFVNFALSGFPSPLFFNVIMRSKKSNKNARSIPLPPAFVDSVKDELGSKEGDALAAALDEVPSVSIRINRKKVEDVGEFMTRFTPYGPSPVEWCRSGFYLEQRPDFILDPLLHAGCYYVQEAASMIYEPIVEWIIGADRPSSMTVLDLCAAPGGKSTAMLNALRGDYILVANEYDRGRSRILKENLDKWGDPQVIVTNSPSRVFASLEGCFDIVAIDAPCSGEGMMRREPIARSQWSENLVEQCSLLQREIVADAVSALAPGGFLIYSTCTFNHKENEENVAWIEETFGLEKVMPGRHFYPHRERCEGLFFALFRKPGEQAERKPVTLQAFVERLKRAGVNVIGEGTEKEVIKGTLVVPSSRMVLAHDFNPADLPVVEVSLEDARAYLRRNAIVLPEGAPEGFVAVAYEGHPLGIVKNLGRRANNLYPAEWRVLKSQ